MNDGGPAFPSVTEAAPEDRGMTLRDYFAAQALVGLLAAEDSGSTSATIHARTAYHVANAMLKAREAE